MGRSVLDIAQFLLKRRKFSRVINLLESRSEYYENDFEYFLTLGTACLYIGDIGNAYSYYQRAREIKVTNTTMLLGQAAIFLRRGETDRALQYYLDILDNDPNNERALSAMEFIRKNSDYSTICRWVDSGKIERFYPPLGINPDIIIKSVFAGFAVGFVVSMFVIFAPQKQKAVVGPRADLTQLELTEDEKKNSQQRDMSDTVIRYLLDNKAIISSYETAMECFLQGRDNACQVEINRLLNSNASLSIKQKCNQLAMYLEVPTFDRLDGTKDNYTFDQVQSDITLYQDCFVVWSGRVSNLEKFEDNSMTSDLLIGYEDLKNVEGVVKVYYPELSSPFDSSKPVRILGKLTFEEKDEEKRIILQEVAIYQPQKKSN